MIKHMLSKINIKKIEEALKNLSAIIPDKINPKEYKVLFNKAKLTIMQLNYVNINTYSIDKIYLMIGPRLELVLNNLYKPIAFNFYTYENPNIILSYDLDGNKRFEYTIDRSILLNSKKQIGMIKKYIGDTYYPSYMEAKDPLMEAIRVNLYKTNQLMGYSHKIDGRKNFYISFKHKFIQFNVKSSQFIQAKEG